ncbi:hypothetical protein OO006_08195 [Prosthecochloris sp. SCSIO W1101]|uniref:hypothetical protein n=1 Tax=Prosthecochloris sp. SCSIO W1101 TaxID=2992242 RepID=UPI00223DCCDC|nr:hypothetical protein [Prosthecochloris sp. SCSIO W1101]UZJ40351.1 hypothetical protein OO006_08195 [Prosthecochloris sp. SCSIO W1101]
MVFNISATLMQFELRLIQEQKQAGLKAVKARVKNGGRPMSSPDDESVQMAKKMSENNIIGSASGNGFYSALSNIDWLQRQETLLFCL